MTDDRDPPPLARHGKRLATSAHRDIRKPYTPAKGVELAAPHEVPFEDTGAIEDPDRRKEIRGNQPFMQRLEHVEEKLHDVGSKQDLHGLKLDHVIEKVDKLVEIEQAKALADIDVGAAMRKDEIAKRASIRDARVKLALWIVTGGIGGWFVHWLLVGGAH